MGFRQDIFLNGVLVQTVDTRTLEDRKNELREIRIGRLVEADIAILKAEDNGADTSAWRMYRQALRDVTDQEDYDNPIWPTKPTE